MLCWCAFGIWFGMGSLHALWRDDSLLYLRPSEVHVGVSYTMAQFNMQFLCRIYFFSRLSCSFSGSYFSHSWTEVYWDWCVVEAHIYIFCSRSCLYLGACENSGHKYFEICKLTHYFFYCTFVYFRANRSSIFFSGKPKCSLWGFQLYTNCKYVHPCFLSPLSAPIITI